MRIRVKFAESARACEVLVGAGVSDGVGEWLKRKHRRDWPVSSVVVITDSRLASHTRRISRTISKAGLRCTVIPVNGGEELKSFERIYSLYADLLEAGIDRHSVAVAVGGGAIGDAVGFLAGTYLRGIRWVGVPTTLLAQVDSAIGGKTGINHERGKNLIGVFHQPTLVACDSGILKALPDRELISGLGEVVKYGLIADVSFFNFLRRSWRRLLSRDARVLERAIGKCVAIKAAIVAEDERDLTGVREVLNFGHTVGHALEAAAGYGHFRHGEAVIWGMRAATRLSVLRGHLAERDAFEIDAFLSSIPVPALGARVRRQALLKAMRLDKKSRGGRVRFVLLSKIGRTVLDDRVGHRELTEALEFIGVTRE